MLRKILTISAIILTVILLASVIAYLIFKKGSEIRKIDTSYWKIYRNENHGFEFKYPSNWIIEVQEERYIAFLPNKESPAWSGELWILSNPQNLPPTAFFKNLEESRKIPGNDRLIYNPYKLSGGEYQKINVAGKEAIFFPSLIGMVETSGVVIPIKKEIIEFFVSPPEESSEELLLKILSTFKFY